jgi:4-hydroxyphenylpyruvate dioxygenase
MILSFDSIEIYVSNHPIFKFLLKYGLGFEEFIKPNFNGKGGVDTSHFIQNSIKLRCSSSADISSQLYKEVEKSGDFIKDVVLEVKDIEQVINNAKVHSATIIEPLKELHSEKGVTKKAIIKAYGSCQHTLIEKKIDSTYDNKFIINNNEGCLENIDHIAVAVEAKNLNKWADFYKNIFGLNKIFEENVITEYSGMNSVVMGNVDNGLRIVLVSPVDGKNKSQISDFLINNNGEGVQHIAFSTKSIFNSVKRLRDKGIEFLNINNEYYNNLRILDESDICRESLKDLQILYDNDEFGELLQIFSKKMHTRLTWFIEIIERRGAKTFGRGNVKKLYESIEKELKKIHENR